MKLDFVMTRRLWSSNMLRLIEPRSGPCLCEAQQLSMAEDVARIWSASAFGRAAAGALHTAALRYIRRRLRMERRALFVVAEDVVGEKKLGIATTPEPSDIEVFPVLNRGPPGYNPFKSKEPWRYAHLERDCRQWRARSNRRRCAESGHRPIPPADPPKSCNPEPED